MAETLAAAIQLDISQSIGALQQLSSQMQQFAANVAAQLQQATAPFQHLATTLQQATQALSHATQAAQAQATAQRAVTQATQQTNVAMQQATASTQQWGTALQVAAGFGIATTLRGLVSSFAALVSESIALAARMQDLNLAFRVIEGSAAKANATISALFATSQRLGLDFQKVVGDFKSFEAATRGTSLEGEKSRLVFEGIASGARAVGVSGAQMHSILVALEQMMSKGKVTAEELRRQLANALPGAIQYLAQGLGITTQALEQMIRSGILPADAAVIALANSMESLGRRQVPEDLDRLSTVFARLKNETSAWMAAIGEGLGTVLKPFLQYLTDISEAMRWLFNIKPPGVAPTRAAPPVAPENLQSLFIGAGRQSGVDPTLLASMGYYESGFNPRAESRKGALGIMQIMPSTAADYGVSQQALLDPVQSIALSARILADYTAKFAQYADATKLGVAAYNAGPGRVQEAIDIVTGKGLPVSMSTVAMHLPMETQKYLANIYQTGTPVSPFGQQGPSNRIADLSAGPSALNPMDAILSGINKALETIPRLRQQFDSLQQSGFNIGGILGKEFTREAQEAVKSYSQVAELLARFPDLAAKLTPEQRAQVEEAGKQVLLLQQQIDNEQGVQAEAERTVASKRELERLALARANLEIQLEEEIAAVAAKGTKARVDDFSAAMDKIRDSFERRFATEDQKVRLSIAIEDAKLEHIKENAAKEIKIQEDLTERLQKVWALGTKTKVDDLKASLDKQRDFFIQHEATQEQLDELARGSQAALRRRDTDETEKELLKQQKAYEKLAQEIQRPLESAFEAILTGSRNLFEAIKGLFVKLLAELAAAAVTRAIVIPVLVKLFGGALGESLGLGAGGATPSAIGQRIQGVASLTGGSMDVNALNGSSIGSISKLVMDMPLSSIFGGGGGTMTSTGTAPGFEGIEGQTGTFTTGSTATVGESLGAIGAGMVVGTMVNNYIYGGNPGGSTQIGAQVGGVVVGAAGAALFGSVGGAVGAFLGELIGGFIGSLFDHPPDTAFRITQAQAGRVSFDPQRGLQLTTPFRIGDTQYRDLGAAGISAFDTGMQFVGQNGEPLTPGLLQLNDQLSASVNALFQQTISAFRGVAPQIQAVLADPLNAAFSAIAEDVKGIKFTGEDAIKNLQVFFNTTIPNRLSQIITPLAEGVNQINPVVTAFNAIIKQAQSDIVRLQQAAMEQHLSLQASIVGIQQSLFTPAQTFEAQRQQLRQGISLLQNASPQQRPGLVTGLQGLIQQVMQGGQSRDVFGGDTGRADAIQEQINALFQDAAINNVPVNAQALKQLQDQLAIEQQRQSESTAQLLALQKELVDVLEGLQDVSAGAFSDMTDIAAKQAELATQQITLLVDSLKDLTSVPDVVDRAMEVLLESQKAMAGISTQGQQDINTQTQLALLTGQVEALQNINQVEIASLQVLQQIANSLAFAPQRQSGVAYVPQNQLSYLHQGEAVVPAWQNRGGMSRGDTVTIHIHAGELNSKQVASTVTRELERGGRFGRHRITVKER